VGSTAAKGNEVTASGVISDVVLGQAGGKAAGSVARSKAESSAENALLNRAADRAERIANNPKVGRPEARQRQASSARMKQEKYVSDAELRGGMVGSGSGQAAGQLLSTPEVDRDQ